ncbi:pappalysin-1-like [Pseudonaja textilis]|uniref:pappalysin-1-like n=1 Tax=Pseudonaja textilis TaxID=8673 RepID=UPI000EA9720A|nr:pappalysin-1-like [Pseudonaja textilis]XP_026579955.1 pappalysin-1-like [Pseudonaja textilis]XP_026579959.1 pappalysin-1-like [Pseudonaja textilis]XP_026579960.1 pappalysin-1-like [Pseudonaja textilis]
MLQTGISEAIIEGCSRDESLAQDNGKKEKGGEKEASEKKVVCTGELKWYPCPSLVRCIKGCEPFGGDNYCDPVNNRAFCNYDDGDCCVSTVKTKKVIPFPMSCDLQGECACLDPNAEEHNQQDHRGFNFA